MNTTLEAEMATIELKLKPWTTPNFATVEQPPRPKQDGMRELPSIPVKELSQEALDGLATEWLRELYEKAGKVQPNWSFEAAP